MPPPPPPVPTPEDPSIAAARNKQRQTDLQRRGRAASILTSGLGVPGNATVNRPAASASDQLG